MNPPDLPKAREDELRTETDGHGGILVEMNQTDPGVVQTIPEMTPEERMRWRPTWMIEAYLEAGYFGEAAARIARAELERRKTAPPDPR